MIHKCIGDVLVPRQLTEDIQFTGFERVADAINRPSKPVLTTLMKGGNGVEKCLGVHDHLMLDMTVW